MKSFLKFLMAFMAAVVLFLGYTGGLAYWELHKQNKEFKSYVSKAIDLAQLDLSSAKKQNMVDKIVTVCNTYIKPVEGRQAFVLMLLFESKFKQQMKSPVGAIGVAQLMPQYFLSFAKTCNIDVKQDDINDFDINLTVGACHYSSILRKQPNVFLAAAGYNSGEESPTVKKLKKFTNINSETANYVAKLASLSKEMELK